MIVIFPYLNVSLFFFLHVQFMMSHMSFPGSFGKLQSPLFTLAIPATTNHLGPLRTLKSRIQTQMSEMDKYHLCQRPTQKITRLKDLIRSDTNVG